MMRLYKLMSDGKHQFLWWDKNGVPKTHHKRDCEHCRLRGYKVGCILPFRKHVLIEKDRPVFSFWKVRLSWKKRPSNAEVSVAGTASAGLPG